jgi:hypothetical protein
MKYKEKEKLWLSNVKELSKTYGWKFKGGSVFKTIGDLYFRSGFDVSMIENAIDGYLCYKTMNIDNVFWDIIDEQPNKKMPLSFRGEAAFCVSGLYYFKYKIDIKDELNPKTEIDSLLKVIDEEVLGKVNTIKTLEDFRTEMMENEKSNSVGIVTSYIEQGNFKNALSKIEEYKDQGINSGFRFEGKDFYDLAKEYCEKTTANKVF